MICKWKHIYGPVHSWRLGMSLGIDPISQDGKICNFDCIYCQLGKTSVYENERKVYVPSDHILEEIDSLPSIMKIDYFTFSGRGEPTLAKNLGEIIRGLKERKRIKIAIITNSSLLGRDDVQSDLMLTDCVMAKLDAVDQKGFNGIDQAMSEIRLKEIVKGIKSFRNKFVGKLALQIMFVEENKYEVQRFVELAHSLEVDEVQINTPLRPSAAQPLEEKDILKIKNQFDGIRVITVYEEEQKDVIPFSEDETIKRHGNYICKKDNQFNSTYI